MLAKLAINLSIKSKMRKNALRHFSLLLLLIVLTLFTTVHAAGIPVIGFEKNGETGYALSVSETGGRAAFNVTLTEVATTDVTFTLTLAGVSGDNPAANQPKDFIIPDPENTGQNIGKIDVTVPAGVTQSSFNLDIVNNDLDQKDRDIRFFISGVTGAVATEDYLTITIRDDENPPILRLTTSNMTVYEDVFSSQVELTIDLVGARSANNIEVQYEIIASPSAYIFQFSGSSEHEFDYAYPGQLSGENPEFGKLKIQTDINGETPASYTFYIGIINDAIPE
ncbi:MAG: hypothetical protein R3240_11270, partial [Gammaproteobacteria bacterium]|nr:hypothetical protein [Gammaproteobacteria bacterium]